MSGSLDLPLCKAWKYNCHHPHGNIVDGPEATTGDLHQISRETLRDAWDLQTLVASLTIGDVEQRGYSQFGPQFDPMPLPTTGKPPAQLARPQIPVYQRHCPPLYAV